MRPRCYLPMLSVSFAATLWALPSLEWLSPAGNVAFRLPATLWMKLPVHCFLVATKGKVKGSIKIGSSSSFLISHLVFPFR